jgi:hypothetical protein
MAKPTLYKVGAIIEQKWMKTSDKLAITNRSAIDYIVDYVLDRITLGRRSAKLKPKSPGDTLLLLKSGTGSGKSTVIAPSIFKKQECSIIVTQPRVLTTVEITHDILRYNSNLTLGDNIGYQTGVVKRRPMKRKGINFVTTGVLLQQFITKGILWISETYNVIIIDEVHEKSLDIETLLYYIKQMTLKYWDNRTFPVIILMSATFNERLYQSYFNIPKENYIEVEGFSFPIQEIWLRHDSQNYMQSAIEWVRKIHITEQQDLKKQQRDIIIFVKGAADITYLTDEIWKLNNDIQLVQKSGYIYPLGLNREIFIENGKRYNDIMQQIEDVKVNECDAELRKCKELTKIKPSRRVIISTNVAETGVTIDTLAHCIDTGYYLNAWYDSIFCSEVMTSSPITKFMATQRKGRVGRKAAGKSYRLYTQETYESLLEDQPSKLITSDITISILNLIISETDSKFAEEEFPDRFNENELYDPFIEASERALIERPMTDKTTVEHDNQYTLEETKNTRFAGKYRVSSKDTWGPHKLDLIELPSADSLFTSLDKLLMLGFIDDNFKPTLMGCMAEKLRKISSESIRMIFAGYAYGANILDLITIAAFIEVGWTNVSKLHRYKYQPRIPINTAGNSGKIASKVLWACDFIEYLWIWDDFCAIVEKIIKSRKKNVINELLEWAILNKMNFNGLLEVVTRRDELIANFITCDMNPFYNGLGLIRGTYNLARIMSEDSKLGISEITKIKRCLLDGYRMFVCRWNPKIQSYESVYKHIPVHIDHYLTRPITIGDEQVRPKTLITSGIIMRQKYQSDMYEYISNDAVSVLDGFVSLDESLVII